MAGTLILWHALNAHERSLIERTVESRVMDSYLPEVTLIAGIFISLMLAWIYHIQASRRREKSGLQILSTAVEQSPVSVMITDVKGNIEYVNPHFTALAGYSPEEAAGKNPRILKSGLQGREFYRDLWTTITSGREWTGEFHNKKKNGELYWEKAKISPIKNKDGVITHFVALKEDVTALKLAEEALKRHTEELERSNRELEQFAYVASHDLQEPLRIVAGYVQLLSRRYKGKLDEKAEEFISFALDATKRMQALISDLLAYSRIGAGGKDFGSVDMEKVLDSTLLDLNPALSERGAEVTRSPLPSVKGDEPQLRRLFQNLIGNAVKYCSEMPRIHVSAEKKADSWLFSVRDNGIGIAPRHHDRIFQIFQRLHAKNEYSGTGIGLAICKKVVENHGGRIWVESEAEKGSTFYFTIPTRGEIA